MMPAMPLMELRAVGERCAAERSEGAGRTLWFGQGVAVVLDPRVGRELAFGLADTQAQFGLQALSSQLAAKNKRSR
jgi:hypothetical protein